VTFGTGLEVTDAPGIQSADPGVNLGGGVRWFLGDWFGVRLDGRYVYTNVEGIVNEWQGNVEATAGVLFTWGGGPPPDEDGDGVPDRKDRCPGTPRGAIVDVNGCPTDRDGDGVFDGIDQCPDTPRGCPVDPRGCPLDGDGDGVIDCQDKCAETARGCQVDATGCPKDTDGDGVCDGLDKCADTPRGCQVDATGCPKDADGDGVCDGLDKCPGSAAGCPVDALGCPQDADGDGVCDGVDKCPATPPGRKVDAKGCEPLPEKAPLRLEGVNFEYDSATLAPESSVALDAVASSLLAWSEVRVEIAGHTDSKGSDAYNLGLSQRRAASVRDYLVGKGVEASRLVAKGYGETEPVADNKTDEGRAQNRRVELRRLD
jgi:outer membrane protein OmpA-like peptidoglycan-associated protein